ncbi:MAG: iron-containing alcohol dehydrogenase [Desulfobacterales bacterium]
MKDKAVSGTCCFQSFSVPFSYPVHFTRNLFDLDNPLLCAVLNRLEENRRHRAIVYADEGVSLAHPALGSRIAAYFENHAQSMELCSQPQVIPGGERIKENWDAVHRIIGEIGEQRLDRQSYVMAIGGGAVLDAVGFAAAIVHRGLRLIRVPTTTLAQNDAGIGVKNSINELGQKNFIGTFAPPFAVLNDADFLTTLDFDHWIAGIAEAFKVAIIKDADFFAFLLQNAEGVSEPESGTHGRGGLPLCGLFIWIISAAMGIL